MGPEAPVTIMELIPNSMPSLGTSDAGMGRVVAEGLWKGMNSIPGAVGITSHIYTLHTLNSASILVGGCAFF